MSVKSKFYQLSKDDFDTYLASIKNREDTRRFLGDWGREYFYYGEKEIDELILKINKLQWEFDQLMDSFSEFGRGQLLISFFIDEIEATNLIENIHSTRHDIYYCMKQVSEYKNTKLTSIVSSYRLLLEKGGVNIQTHQDIRDCYESLLGSLIEKEDKPDGRFYRKEAVFISDGIKNVHTGIKGEYVEEAMSEFIELNQSSMNVFEKILIAHFLIETIHPYYDGNGRLGRYLLANQLYLETNSYTSFLMSKAFSNHKSQYYKAFKEARDMHEFGCINGFVKQTATILLEEMEKVNEGLKLKKYLVEDLECTFSLSKAEAKIYRILKEGSLLSEFGLTLQEIMKETGVSKRTLMYALQKFKEMDVVEEIKIGRFSYLKLKLFDNVKE